MPAAPRAMARALDKAATVGCGFAAVRNSRHTRRRGPLLAHGARPGHGRHRECATGPGTAMVPTFGREARLSTNPMSVAAPARRGAPFMMDFGTTVVAGGKMELALRDNKPVPPAWLRDKDGRPSSDPRDFFAGGTIPPLGGDAETGGYKAYALAVMVYVFSAAPFGTGYGVMLTLQTQGVFLGAWQVEAFLPIGDFTSMLATRRSTRSGRRRPPTATTRPHARRAGMDTQEERNRLGIPLHPTVAEELRAVGAELGVPFPSAVPVPA